MIAHDAHRVRTSPTDTPASVPAPPEDFRGGQPVSQTSAPRPPAGRYGPEPTRARRARRALVVATGAVIVIGVMVWLAYGTTRNDVSWEDVGYKVQGDERVDVRFRVTKNPAATAECTLQALNRGFAEVGVVTVTVGPADTRTQDVTASVATQERAVTGVVDSCRLTAHG
jgi:hypothetical protein